MTHATPLRTRRNGWRGPVVVAASSLLFACPDHDEIPDHLPLDTRGDASSFDRTVLGPFFDAAIRDATSGDAADAGSTTGELAVLAIRDGAPAAGVEVLLHDATGRVVQRFSTGADGRVRTRDRAVVAASIIIADTRQSGENTYTVHDVTTWFDVPRDRDVLLSGGDYVGAAPTAPLDVDVALPGAFAGADRYRVAVCDHARTTTVVSERVQVSGGRCPGASGTLLIADALDARGQSVAHSETMLPALTPDITRLDVALPAWRTARRTVQVQLDGLAARGDAEGAYAAFWGFGGETDIGPPAHGEGVLAARLAMEVDDLAPLDVPLLLGLTGRRRTMAGPGISTDLRWTLFDLLPGETSQQTYDLERDVVATPGNLSVELSNPRRPRLQIDGEPPGLPSKVVAVQLERREATAPANGSTTYRWRAIARGGPSLTLQIPDLGTTVGNLIAASTPNYRLVLAIDSDALDSVGAVAALGHFDVIFRDGPPPMRRRASRAYALLRSP